jgi:excisionase family DNA binding protein
MCNPSGPEITGPAFSSRRNMRPTGLARVWASVTMKPPGSPEMADTLKPSLWKERGGLLREYLRESLGRVSEGHARRGGAFPGRSRCKKGRDHGGDGAPMTACLTIEEVAARLRVTKRWLQDWLRDHTHDQHGVAFYRVAGRRKLFTEDSVARILAAFPQPKASTCSSSSHPARGTHRTGASGGPILGTALSEALKLATERLPPSSSQSGERKSNVVPMPVSTTPHSPVRR